MAFAVLLDQGYDPGEALLLITESRPQARANYAEQALAWYLDRIDAEPGSATRRPVPARRPRPENASPRW